MLYCRVTDTVCVTYIRKESVIQHFINEYRCDTRHVVQRNQAGPFGKQHVAGLCERENDEQAIISLEGTAIVTSGCPRWPLSWSFNVSRTNVPLGAYMLMTWTLCTFSAYPLMRRLLVGPIRITWEHSVRISCVLYSQVIILGYFFEEISYCPVCDAVYESVCSHRWSLHVRRKGGRWLLRCTLPLFVVYEGEPCISTEFRYATAFNRSQTTHCRKVVLTYPV